MSDLTVSANVQTFLASADLAAMLTNLTLSPTDTPEFSGVTLSASINLSAVISIGDSVNGVGNLYLGQDGVLLSDAGGVFTITAQPDSETHNGGIVDGGNIDEVTRDALAFAARPGAQASITRGFGSIRPQFYDGVNWYEFHTTDGFIPQDDPASPANNKEMMFVYVNDTTLRIRMRGNDGVLRTVDLTLVAP